MYTYLHQALPRIVMHRTLVVKKECKLRVRFSPKKENRVHQTKISTKTDKDGFLPAVFGSRLEQKIPVTECLVCSIFMLRMGSCVLFCCHKILVTWELTEKQLKNSSFLGSFEPWRWTREVTEENFSWVNEPSFFLDYDPKGSFSCSEGGWKRHDLWSFIAVTGLRCFCVCFREIMVRSLSQERRIEKRAHILCYDRTVL